MDTTDVSAGAPIAAPRRLGVERRPFTTPVGLRLATVVLLLGVLVVGAVTVRSAVDRRDAADAIGLEAAPLLVEAENLYVALADADAAASTAFLRPGFEPRALRTGYLDDIKQANQELTNISRSHEPVAQRPRRPSPRSPRDCPSTPVASRPHG